MINPKYVGAWNGKGAALDDLKRYEEAIASYDKALEIDNRVLLKQRLYFLDQ
jgi:tetratricopeptide (TPR) repeat protein